MTLLALFKQQRPGLQQKLEAAESVTAAITAVDETLEALQRRFINDVTAPQARAVGPMMMLLRQAPGFLSTASRTAVWYQPVKRRADSHGDSLAGEAAVLSTGTRATLNRMVGSSKFLGGMKPRVLQTVIAVGLLAGLASWSLLSWTAWPAMILVLALIGLELLIGHRAKRAVGGAARDEPKVTVQVDPKTFLDRLEMALDVIDRAVPPAAGTGAVTGAPGGGKDAIERIPELLEVVQDLLAESRRNDATLTLKRCDQLEPVLTLYGVKVQNFQPDAAEQAATAASAWFDFEPSLDPNANDYTLLKPALVKDGRALLRGRVVTPAGVSS
jgi:hypothetical protein